MDLTLKAPSGSELSDSDLISVSRGASAGLFLHGRNSFFGDKVRVWLVVGLPEEDGHSDGTSGRGWLGEIEGLTSISPERLSQASSGL